MPLRFGGNLKLKDRGLSTVPTPRRPARALVVSSVHRMLTNPYYKGDVVYKGVVYRGSHEALVPPEVWYQVQSVLASHKSAADATQVHSHYLKGSVFCGQCGSRLIITNAKNRHGNVYPYFVCAGRHSKRTTCTRQAVLIEDVERLIEGYYRRVGLTPTHREALSGMLRSEFDRMMAAETAELSALTSNRDQLEAEQLRLLQAHYADAIPLSLLKKEQGRIVAELDHLNHRLEQHHGEYTAVTDTLDKSLEVLDDIATLYSRCDDLTRRLCNQAFFEKIYLDDDNELQPELAKPFELLLDPDVHASALTWAKKRHGVQTPADISSAGGLNPVRRANALGWFSNPPKTMKSLDARVSWKTFGGVADRRDAALPRGSRGRVRQIGMAQTHLSRAQVDELVGRYEAGENVRALATAFGIHRSTVSAHLTRRGVRRQAGLNEVQMRRAGDMYQRGMTLDEIAAELGTSQRTVGRALDAVGVRRRGPGPRRSQYLSAIAPVCRSRPAR